MASADVWLSEHAGGFRDFRSCSSKSPEHLDQIILNPTGLIRDRIRIFCCVLCTLEGLGLKLFQPRFRIYAKKQSVDK